MLTSLIAFYVSGAIVIDSVMKREVLPIGKAGMRLAR
jgi:hypothetical protein